MSMTYANAKIYVARIIGGQNDTNVLAWAGDSIQASIQDWNTEHDWKFLLQDNSASPISVVAGTDTYTLPTAFRKPYTARLLTNPRTLEWIDLRMFDRMVPNQSAQSTPTHYTMFNPTSFDASTPLAKIKLMGAPGAADQLLVRYYRPIAAPSGANDVIDIPDLYLYKFLDYARGHFLLTKDPRNEKAPMWVSLMAKKLEEAISDDDDDTEDDDVRFMSQMEQGVRRSWYDTYDQWGIYY